MYPQYVSIYSLLIFFAILQHPHFSSVSLSLPFGTHRSPSSVFSICFAPRSACFPNGEHNLYVRHTHIKQTIFIYTQHLWLSFDRIDNILVLLVICCWLLLLSSSDTNVSITTTMCMCVFFSSPFFCYHRFSYCVFPSAHLFIPKGFIIVPLSPRPLSYPAHPFYPLALGIQHESFPW